jgi:prepilin-type processing-associated H-X9-DG protein
MDEVTWHITLSPYTGSPMSNVVEADNTIFRCPSAPWKREDEWQVWEGLYGMNYLFSGPPHPWPDSALEPVKIVRISSFTDVPLVADSEIWVIGYGSYFGNALYHFGKGSVLFCDGHVETRSTEEYEAFPKW